MKKGGGKEDRGRGRGVKEGEGGSEGGMEGNLTKGLYEWTDAITFQSPFQLLTQPSWCMFHFSNSRQREAVRCSLNRMQRGQVM